jgi:hypothetical protein
MHITSCDSVYCNQIKYTINAVFISFTGSGDQQKETEQYDSPSVYE